MPIELEALDVVFWMLTNRAPASAGQVTLMSWPRVVAVRLAAQTLPLATAELVLTYTAMSAALHHHTKEQLACACTQGQECPT